MSKYGPPTEFQFGWFDSPPPKRDQQEQQVSVPLDTDQFDDLASRILATVRAITGLVKEQSPMIQYDGNATAERQNNRGGIPFLKTENVSPAPSLCKVLAAKTGKDNKGKDQLSLKISYRSHLYIWTLRSNNPNVKKLIDMFGSDETQYKDVEFGLGLEADDFTGRNWPAVSPLPKKATR